MSAIRVFFPSPGFGVMNPFDSNPFGSEWGAPSNPFAASSGAHNQSFDVTRGLSQLEENKEESETFSVSEVRYKPPSPIIGLVTNNNILVFALENGHIIRLNLLEPAGLEGISNVLLF
jgi:hypothetical protein